MSISRRVLCDSNYGEGGGFSFAPLVAYIHSDATVTITNTAQPRGKGFAFERYPSIEDAAEERAFVRRWLADCARARAR